MDKRSLHHLWTRIRPIKTWYFLVVFLVCLAVCAFALKGNNLTMIKLREQVYQADKNSGDVEAALQKLRAYVTAHMNTSLTAGTSSVYPPIQLKYTYERLVSAERERVNKVNSGVYTQAQKHCERLYPDSFSGGPRVPCIENYVADRGIQPKHFPSSLYKFDFVSPAWSPDLAGWSAVASAIALFLLIARFGLGRWLEYKTR